MGSSRTGTGSGAGAALAAQARRVGGVVLAGPVVAGGAVALAGWGGAVAWAPTQAMTLVSWLTQVFVVGVGACAAVALTGDQLVELHESTPTGFRAAQLLRAALVTAAGVAGAVLMFGPLHALGVWPRDAGWISVTSPAGAVVILAVVALLAAAYARTLPATVLAVVAAWMALELLWDPYVIPLLQQRGIPLAATLPALVAIWRRLGHPEHNIGTAATA